VLARRVLGSWPFFIWIIAIGTILVLYSGHGRLVGITGIVDTTSDPVAPIETARLISVDVMLGHRVKAGDKLAEMDTALVDAEIAQLDAQIHQFESSMNDFARRTLLMVQDFEDSIKNAQSSMQNFQGQLDHDEAELEALEAEQERRDDLAKRGLIGRTEQNELKPQIAGLSAQLKSYPALIEIERRRLHDARKGKQDLLDSLRLQEAETVQDAIARRAESDRTMLEAARGAVEWQRKAYTLYASRDGVVSRIFHHPGTVIQAGEPVLRVVSESPSMVIGMLPEEHLTKIKSGDRVSVSRQTAQHKRVWAEVLTIAPEVDRLPMRTSPIQGQSVRGRRVILQLEPGHNFIPGETVRIEGTQPSIRQRFDELLRPFRD
jgi:HlyD family secretion protein